MTNSKYDTDELIPLALELSRLVRRVTYDRTMAGTNVNLLQLYGLMCIEETLNLTMRELADHLKISSSTATTFVDRLVRSRWVKRVADPKNRTIVRLQLTPVGKRMLAKTREQKRKKLGEAFKTISPADRRQFAEALAALVTALQNIDSHRPS